MKKAEIFNDCSNHLGEGPIWSNDQQTLYWLDLPMPSKLFKLHLPTNNLEIFEMPEMISAMAVRPNGDMLVASHHGINNYNFQEKKLTKILDIEPEKPQNRCNDGAADSKGRFWVGTMQNNLTPEATDIEIVENSGSLYCINQDLSFKKLEDNIGISNTIVWSPDSKKFYFTDTLTGIINSYDCNIEEGTISNKTFFAKHERGFPDGSIVDSDGCLWSCRWGGSCVIRFDPNGKVDDIIELPVQNITSCTFGGKDLKTLFITTARYGISQEQMKQQPLSGGLFAINLNIQGIPDNSFSG